MRVVVCGEALIDLMPQGEQAEPGVSPDPSSWSARSGGSPMNTAVALARQGCPVSFLGRLGNDRFADQLMTHLTRSGVGTELIVRHSSPTTLAVVTPRPRNRTRYSFHWAGTANFGWQLGEFPILEEDDWLHFGSLTTIIDPGASELLRWLHRLDNPMSLDLNVRPSILSDKGEYWSHIEPLLHIVGAQGGMLKASAEDLAWLADAEKEPDFDPLELAVTWALAYDLSMVLVTLGEGGAVAVKPDGRLEHCPGFPVSVVDTVGAGDTFTAGFLSAWLDNPGDVAGALRRGCAAGALVCQRQGAEPPLAGEIDAFLARRIGQARN